MCVDIQRQMCNNNKKQQNFCSGGELARLPSRAGDTATSIRGISRAGVKITRKKTGRERKRKRARNRDRVKSQRKRKK